MRAAVTGAFAALGLGAILATAAASQQVADTLFNPPIPSPAYPEERGPRVGIDEAHTNFHTAGGRYLAFARLLRRDGYRVAPFAAKFSAESLTSLDILVISNALGDTGNVVVPTRPAFTDAEVEAVRRWVEEGGGLLLIADHMPMAGAAASLARAFGIHFINGYAGHDVDGEPSFRFRRADGSLAPHPIREGRSRGEAVDSVLSFTGQAFRATVAVDPVLIIPSPATLYLTQRWGVFTDSTPTMVADGFLQGATLRYGRGRVALFGEAAMFSAQRAGREEQPMGMNDPKAAQNPRFVLNTMHWLSGLLPEGEGRGR
ncbi:MAG TPA: DUF4350 domain-containing protein [Gemmatimonadales bacterium]